MLTLIVIIIQPRAQYIDCCFGIFINQIVELFERRNFNPTINLVKVNQIIGIFIILIQEVGQQQVIISSSAQELVIAGRRSRLKGIVD